MKNSYSLSAYFSVVLLSSLVLLPGCMKKKDAKKDSKKMSQITGGKIPTAGKKGSSKYLNSDVEALVLEDDARDVYAYSIKDKAPAKLSAADQDWDAHNSKTFEPIYFNFDKHDIRKDQAPVVAYNVEKAREEITQGKKLKVEGHADKQYLSEVYNIAVSQKRAHTVAKKLAQSGVDASLISTVGYGDKHPAVDVAGREEKNRRAEIVAL